jgi:uncharacterized delta-60 repeat protein
MIVVRRAHAPFAVAAVLLSGCGLLASFGDYDTSAPNVEGGALSEGGAGLALGRLAPIFVRRGASVALPIAIERRGVTGPVTVDVSQLPVGVTATSAAFPTGTSVQTLTITTTPATPFGSFSALVRASATGGAPSDSEVVVVNVTGPRLDPSFGDGGVVVGPPGDTFEDLDTDPAGHVLLAALVPNDTAPPHVVFYRDDGQGAMLRAAERDLGKGYFRIAFTPSGSLLVSGVLGSGSPRVDAFPPDGGPPLWSTSLDTGPVDVGRLVVAPNGAVTVVATAFDGNGGARVVLERLGPNGGVDTTFGPDGGLTFDPSPRAESAGAAILTAQGLVVCSTHVDTVDLRSDAVLRRVGTNGALDPSFGDAGSVVITAGSGQAFQCNDLVASGSRVIVAGTTLPSTQFGPSALVTLVAIRQDGTLDPSFGVAGLAVHTALGEALARAIAVPASLQQIYTAGTTREGTLLLGDLPDGAPDPLFGATGSLLSGTNTPTRDSVVLRILPDGRVVMAGSVQVGDAISWFVARYLP